MYYGTMQVIYDKVTGRSRGFGFVTMSKIEEVEAAAQQFNGYVSFRNLRICVDILHITSMILSLAVVIVN